MSVNLDCEYYEETEILRKSTGRSMFPKASIKSTKCNHPDAATKKGTLPEIGCDIEQNEFCPHRKSSVY